MQKRAKFRAKNGGFGAKVFDFCRFFPNKFLTGEVMQSLVTPATIGFTAIFPREKLVEKTFFAQLKETFAEISVKLRAGHTWRGFQRFRLPPPRSAVGFSPPMDFFMAADTKAHQIVRVIGAALGKWFLVMNQGSQFYFPVKNRSEKLFSPNLKKLSRKFA